MSDGGEEDDEDMEENENKECQGEGRVKDEDRGNWKDKELEIRGGETGEVENDRKWVGSKMTHEKVVISLHRYRSNVYQDYKALNNVEMS